MSAPPSRIHVGSAVLLPAPRLLRGPAAEVHLAPQAVRFVARLAAARGTIVPFPELVECLYPPGAVPAAQDGGRRTLAVVAARTRRALREVGAGVGIATTKGGPRATGTRGGMRLDPAAAQGAVVHERRDYRRLLEAKDAGASGQELADRFGYSSAVCARNIVLRAKRRAFAEMQAGAGPIAAPDAGAVP